MVDQSPEIELLQASVDPDDEPSEFRILVDQKSVKYLRIDPGLYDVDDMCFAPSLISIIPALPPGVWNSDHISRHPDGHPHFASVTKAQLPGVTNIWHPLQLDHLELRIGKKLRSNVYEATCPRFGSTVIAKFARFKRERPHLDAETTAYQ